jgi:hypothetical protein
VADLPAEAYGEVANAFKTNPGGAGGIKPQSIETPAGLGYYTVEEARDVVSGNVRRYSMIVPGIAFSGYIAVQVPENASKIYTDDAVRQMFASAVVRKEVPVEEQLGLLPFKISELGDFKNVRTLAPGSAIVVADGDGRTIRSAPSVIAIIGATPTTLTSPVVLPGRSRRRFQRRQIRCGGAHRRPAGYETQIDAASGRIFCRNHVQYASAARPRCASSAAHRATAR